MRLLPQWWVETLSPRVRELWSRHGWWVLGVGTAYMVVAAIGHHVYAVPHLLAESAHSTGLDLQLRHAEVRAWFEGRPVYGVIQPGDYPPASYLMLWPILGWVSLDAAPWVWASTAFFLLCLIGIVSARVAAPQLSASARMGRTWHAHVPPTFLALLVFSIYPTQMTVFLGQLGIHSLGFLLLAFYAIDRNQAGGRARRDLTAAGLLTLALVKPTSAAPFFWVAALRGRGLRTAGPTVAIYASLTVVAATFQPDGPFALVQAWFMLGASETRIWDGMTNAHRWLTLAGWEERALLVSLLILGAHGVWTYRHRHADLWILLGVAALVARLWTHHRPHDDILLLVPLLSLFRLAARPASRDGTEVAAGILFAGLWGNMHIPIWAFYELPDFVPVLIEISQTILWLATLSFLLFMARRHSPNVRSSVRD